MSPKVKRAYLQQRLYGNAELPAICLAIRSAVNGSADPQNRFYLWRAVVFLDRVLDSWEDTAGPEAAFEGMIDCGVKMMVMGTKLLLTKHLRTTETNDGDQDYLQGSARQEARGVEG